MDRVLNERPGVRKATIDRVQKAITTLGYVRDTAAANLARQRQYNFVFVLPDGKGQFLAGLRRSIDEAAEGARYDRTGVQTVLLPPLDHMALPKALDAIDPDRLDGLAIMANETPVVRDTIARLKKRGVPVVSVVADQPNSGRDHFVGIDNVAAGRTAGTLIGRFVGDRAGKVIVVVTSRQSRDMIDRRLGFDEVMTAAFPNLTPLPSVEGHDDPDLTQRVTTRALENNPDAVGIYSVGASVRGVAAAIKATPLTARPVCVDHELTENSADLLRQGVLDAVITQNTGHLVRSALRILRARSDGSPVIKSQENIRIDIVIRENIPLSK